MTTRELKYLVPIFAIVFLISGHCLGQKKDKSSPYILTAEKVLLVNIDSSTYSVKVTLHNYSDDTLYFHSSSCSWQDFYTINSDMFVINRPKCSENRQIVVALAPNARHTVELSLTRIKVIKLAPVFKVGFQLAKAQNLDDKSDFNKLDRNVQLIWSATTTL